MTVILMKDFCIIKTVLYIATLLLTFQMDLNGAEKTLYRTISVVDAKNEKIAGAAVELVGTGKVFYTNLNGDCEIPEALFLSAKSITINYISYKTSVVLPENTNTKVILTSR